MSSIYSLNLLFYFIICIKYIQLSDLTDTLHNPSQAMDDFLCASMFQVFCDNIGPMYPLIFSPEYPKV